MEHPAYSSFKIVHWFYFFNFDFPLFTQIASVRVICFSNIRCPPLPTPPRSPEKSNDIASFVEHPIYSGLKIYNVLILLFLFYFVKSHPKRFCKSHFFLKFRCFAKRAVLLHLSWGTQHVAISKHIVSWFFFIIILISHNSPKMLL